MQEKKKLQLLRKENLPIAGVVELVDSLDLGSNAKACRFESCRPHQILTAIAKNAIAVFCKKMSPFCVSIHIKSDRITLLMFKRAFNFYRRKI